MAVRSEARKIMSVHEEKPALPGEPTPDREKPTSGETPRVPSGEQWPSWGGMGTDPAPMEVGPYPRAKTYPADLQISWSWPHFAVFVVFVISLLLSVPFGLFAIFGPHGNMTQELLQKFLSEPQVSLGGTVVIFALLLFFLYVTLALLRGQPFWRTLGWRKLVPASPALPRNPFAYLFAGSGLSLFVALATTGMKTPESAPIEELFKNPHTAMLFVAMAVFVAPLVEETLFRGYLYPMFARSFGVTPAILLTGVLFGLMHGAQTAWTWGLVAMLTLVGIVFTFVRARTGSVLASFMMHLGYNLLIALVTGVSTHWFTKMPTN